MLQCYNVLLTELVNQNIKKWKKYSNKKKYCNLNSLGLISLWFFRTGTVMNYRLPEDLAIME